MPSGDSLRLAWVTDPHLNFVTRKDVDRFCSQIADETPDAVLIGGDIGEAHSFAGFLSRVESLLQRPIHFILGNHDFYFGSITEVRCKAVELTRRSRWSRYLPESRVVELNGETALVGHDSWADGRHGSGNASRVMLTDFVAIRDLAGLTPTERFRKLESLGDEAATHFEHVLAQAFAAHRRVVLLTHVPPFPEASLYKGRPADEDYLPHFCCQSVGSLLLATMQERPEQELLVLCGHTHEAASTRILPNLRVETGGAEYGRPTVQNILEISEGAVRLRD